MTRAGLIAIGLFIGAVLGLALGINISGEPGAVEPSSKGMEAEIRFLDSNFTIAWSASRANGYIRLAYGQEAVGVGFKRRDDSLIIDFATPFDKDVLVKVKILDCQDNILALGESVIHSNTTEVSVPLNWKQEGTPCRIVIEIGSKD